MRTTHEPARFQTAPSNSTSASPSTCAASSYIYITIITPASLHATCSLGQQYNPQNKGLHLYLIYMKC